MLISHGTTGRGSVNKMSWIVSIQEFCPAAPVSSASLLSSPQMAFHCKPPFSLFPHFLSVLFLSFLFSCLSSFLLSYSGSSLLAKARLVQLWFLAIPPRLEQTWTVPRWARRQLAGSVEGLVVEHGWMDGWMDGLLACSLFKFFFLLMAYSCFALPQSLWTCTNNCCVFCRVHSPQFGFTLS